MDGVFSRLDLFYLIKFFVHIHEPRCEGPAHGRRLYEDKFARSFQLLDRIDSPAGKGNGIIAVCRHLGGSGLQRREGVTARYPGDLVNVVAEPDQSRGGIRRAGTDLPSHHQPAIRALRYGVHDPLEHAFVLDRIYLVRSIFDICEPVLPAAHRGNAVHLIPYFDVALRDGPCGQASSHQLDARVVYLDYIVFGLSYSDYTGLVIHLDRLFAGHCRHRVDPGGKFLDQVDVIFHEQVSFFFHQGPVYPARERHFPVSGKYDVIIDISAGDRREPAGYKRVRVLEPAFYRAYHIGACFFSRVRGFYKAHARAFTVEEVLYSRFAERYLPVCDRPFLECVLVDEPVRAFFKNVTLVADNDHRIIHRVIFPVTSCEYDVAGGVFRGRVQVPAWTECHVSVHVGRVRVRRKCIREHVSDIFIASGIYHCLAYRVFRGICPSRVVKDYVSAGFHRALAAEDAHVRIVHPAVQVEVRFGGIPGILDEYVVHPDRRYIRPGVHPLELYLVRPGSECPRGKAYLARGRSEFLGKDVKEPEQDLPAAGEHLHHPERAGRIYSGVCRIFRRVYLEAHVEVP